jgi:tetratricopeptide (TPR) repeat protein
MDDIKQKIINARDERETGDPEKALDMFLQIDVSPLESDQQFDYLGELGLTYWHVKKYEEAEETFESLLQKAKESKNASYQAVALRHLSRPEFNKDTPERSVEYAKKARELALEAKREDLAWFDHGVVLALISNEAPEDEIKEWFDIEAQDLVEVSKNTKDEIAKWVWTSGLLMDRALVFNSKADLYLALMIAEEFNLLLRIEQIKKLISEFED